MKKGIPDRIIVNPTDNRTDRTSYRLIESARAENRRVVGSRGIPKRETGEAARVQYVYVATSPEYEKGKGPVCPERSSGHSPGAFASEHIGMPDGFAAQGDNNVPSLSCCGLEGAVVGAPGCGDKGRFAGGNIEGTAATGLGKLELVVAASELHMDGLPFDWVVLAVDGEARGTEAAGGQDGNIQTAGSESEVSNYRRCKQYQYAHQDSFLGATAGGRQGRNGSRRVLGGRRNFGGRARRFGRDGNKCGRLKREEACQLLHAASVIGAEIDVLEASEAERNVAITVEHGNDVFLLAEGEADFIADIFRRSRGRREDD